MDIPRKTNTVMEQNSDFTRIREWASERGIYLNGDVKTQYIKLMEEAGELGQAILKENEAEFKDAIGDMVVVLTNLAHLGNTTIEECITGAWDEIKNRKGKMQNGTFVKSIAEMVSEASKDWADVTEEQLIKFFTEVCINDFQFDRANDGYTGFINLDPGAFGKELYDVCLFIINERENAEIVANRLGLTIESADSDELIIYHINRNEDEWYMCVGLREEKIGYWAERFKIGKAYLKANKECNIEGCIYIHNDGIDSYDFCVDASQFDKMTSRYEH